MNEYTDKSVLIFAFGNLEKMFRKHTQRIT